MKKIFDFIKNFIKKKKPLVICGAILIIAIVAFLLFGWLGLWYEALIIAIVSIALTDIKKHSILKVLSIILLLITLASYILPGRNSFVEQLGIADVLTNYLGIVLQNFSYIVLFLLTIGGFYGVLSKTSAYKKLLDNIVTYVKPLNNKIIYLIILLFAVTASLTGMTIPLFIFIPFFASIILLLGYDKLVAFSATIGSIIVGYIGGIFVNFINPNTNVINTYEQFVGMDKPLANVFPKLLLLFVGIALLIYFVNRHIKNTTDKKVKYELSDNSELLIAEVKGSYKDIKVWPLIVILSITFVILVLGMMPWSNLFNVNIFTKFHEWLIGLKIKDIAVIPTIISTNLPALGEWSTSGNILAPYIYMSMLLIFATLIISLVNKIKVNEAIDNYTNGIKKMLPTAFLVTLAYTVLVCAYNNGFIENIISNYGKFNYFISSLLALLGCILNVDTIWIMAGVFSPIVTLITDESIYASVALLLQGIYGIFSLVGPTSLILIIGLTYLDIPYTTWLKYIWRFILMLIIAIALVTLLVILI